MRYENLTSPIPDPESGNTPPARAYERADAHAPTERPSGDRLVRPMADREVPLPDGRTQMLVHTWLDGDATAVMVRATQGGNDAIDLWTKINGEAELLRTRTTPLYVHKRIMESLPNDVHRVNRPWYTRSVALNPGMLIVAAAALLGIGALVARIAAH